MNKIENITSVWGLLKKSFSHYSKIHDSIFKLFGILVLGFLFFEYLYVLFPKLINTNNVVLELFLSVLFLGFIIFTTLMLMGFTASLSKKKPVSLKRMMKRGKKLILPSIWVSMILLVIQIGSFMLIVPGIILSIYLIFAKLSVLIDSKKGFKALSYSFNLVRGYWFDILFSIMFFFLVISFVGLLFILVLNLLTGTGFTFSASISMFNFMLVFPITLIYTYELYEDVKSKTRIKGKADEVKVINGFTVWGSIMTIMLSIAIVYLTIVYLK